MKLLSMYTCCFEARYRVRKGVHCHSGSHTADRKASTVDFILNDVLKQYIEWNTMRET